MKFGYLEGVPQPDLGDLLTIVINHLLNGIILQVDPPVESHVFWAIY